MKAFDLEKALAGEPVVTRDGRPVEQLTFFKCKDPYCLYAVVGGLLMCYTINGLFENNDTSGHDLFMAEKPKVKKEGWVNLFPSGTKHKAKCGFYVYDSEQEAIEDAHHSRMTTVKIEWEEEAE